MKKIIHLLPMSIKYHLKINHREAFSFSISSSFKTGKLKLIYDVIYSRIENEFTKQRISLKKLVKFIQFFHEYARTLYHYIRVKFN